MVLCRNRLCGCRLNKVHVPRQALGAREDVPVEPLDHSLHRRWHIQGRPCDYRVPDE